MCKVFQMLELPSELEEKETYQALLLTERSLFLESAVNGSRLQLEDRRSFSALLSAALDTYEAACSEASAVGVDLVTKVGGGAGNCSNLRPCRNMPSTGTLFSHASSA